MLSFRESGVVNRWPIGSETCFAPGRARFICSSVLVPEATEIGAVMPPHDSRACACQFVDWKPIDQDWITVVEHLATGMTIYLQKDGRLEHAQHMASTNHRTHEALRSDKGRDRIEQGEANPVVTFIEFMG
jgi:hypothetical protein